MLLLFFFRSGNVNDHHHYPKNEIDIIIYLPPTFSFGFFQMMKIRLIDLIRIIFLNHDNVNLCKWHFMFTTTTTIIIMMMADEACERHV